MNKLLLKAWEGAYSHLSAFKAQKSVKIQDIRLGVLLLVLQILIVGWVLFDLVRQKGHLLLETPSGLITPWSSRGDADWVQKAASKIDEAFYCSDTNAFDFEYDAEFTYSNFQCTLFPSGTGGIKNGGTSLFYPTYLRRDQSFQLIKPAAGCPAAESLLSGSRLLPLDLTIGGVDVCMYERRTHLFVAGPELSTVNFWHSFRAPLVEMAASMPKSYLRDFKGNVEKVLEPGITVEGDLTYWMNLAGLDMDIRMDQQPVVQLGGAVVDEALQARNGTAEPGALPTVRLVGATLTVTINYYNYGLAPDFYDADSKRGDVIAVIDVAADLNWNSLGDNIEYEISNQQDPQFLNEFDLQGIVAGGVDAQDRPFGVVGNLYQHGINVEFRLGGSIGRFSWSSLVSSLVNGLVLLSVAQSLVQFVAEYGLGLHSKLYKAFMKESVNYKKSLARFTSQAIVAGMAFKSMDASTNDQLDGGEVYSAISRYINGTKHDDSDLTPQETLALSHFLTTITDDAANDSNSAISAAAKGGKLKEQLAEHSVGITEWINIFTDPAIDMDSVKSVLHLEYAAFLSKFHGQDVEAPTVNPLAEGRPGTLTHGP